MKPISKDPFEHYFYKRAQLSDDLVTSGAYTDAYMLATSSLDALAEIWLTDFPDIKQNLDTELGGSIPSSIRLARFLKEFASSDPDVKKVAVLCFAEDWKHYRPQDAHIANQLINKRLSDNTNELIRSHTLPDSSLDISREELSKECPEIASQPHLFALAEEYEYGALIYTFYHCPLVHSDTGSRRTHRFARGEESMYYWSHYEDNRTTIGFGNNLVTRWLRHAVSGYVQSCEELGIVPANNFDAGSSHEKRFEKKWTRF
jgi:hypothetical protein